MNPSPVAVTVVGVDRPGIVASVTRALYELGCNLEDATSTILRGHFSMMLVVRTPEGTTAETVEESLNATAKEMELVVTARAIHEGAVDPTAPTHMVSVYGADRPGIVFQVADLLAAAGANITDLTSRLIDSGEEPVYALMLEVAAPDEVDLESALDELRGRLKVELSAHPIEADLL
jgi:glycine cleavage system transcriptional repressor